MTEQTTREEFEATIAADQAALAKTTRRFADPEEEIRRLCGCLLVIASAEGCGNGALRTAAYEAATMGRTVQDLHTRLGVPVPWVRLDTAVTGGSQT